MSKQRSCGAWSCLPKLVENGEHNMSLPQHGQKYQAQGSSRDFVLPLNALHRDMLGLVGGKAANLGELTNAKFPVPPGFCVATNAYALVVLTTVYNCAQIKLTVPRDGGSLWEMPFNISARGRHD